MQMFVVDILLPIPLAIKYYWLDIGGQTYSNIHLIGLNIMTHVNKWESHKSLVQCHWCQFQFKHHFKNGTLILLAPLCQHQEMNKRNIFQFPLNMSQSGLKFKPLNKDCKSGASIFIWIYYQLIWVLPAKIGKRLWDLFSNYN